MKRFIGFLLSACLLVSLAACGQKTAPAGAPTWQEQYNLGIRYLSEGNYEEAIIAFSAVIDIDPKNTGALSGRGQAYVLSGETAGNLTAALADFEAALAADETLAEVWLGLADVYIRMGEYDKALEVLKEGLSKTNHAQSIADKIAEVESGIFTDSSGNTRRMNHYDSSGTLTWYHIYTYNRDGEKASVTSYDASGVKTGQVMLEYDSVGNATALYNYNPQDGAVGAIEHRYDGNGNSIEQFYYSPDGTLESRYVNAYDANGNMIRREIYPGGGTLSDTVLFEYNASNQRTKLETYDSNGVLTGYSIYGAYDKFGNCLEEFVYDKDGGLMQRELRHYDKQGNFLGYEVYDAQGNLMESTIYE